MVLEEFIILFSIISSHRMQLGMQHCTISSTQRNQQTGCWTGQLSTYMHTWTPQISCHIVYFFLSTKKGCKLIIYCLEVRITRKISDLLMCTMQSYILTPILQWLHNCVHDVIQTRAVGLLLCYTYCSWQQRSPVLMMRNSFLQLLHPLMKCSSIIPVVLCLRFRSSLFKGKYIQRQTLVVTLVNTIACDNTLSYIALQVFYRSSFCLELPDMLSSNIAKFDRMGMIQHSILVLASLPSWAQFT